MASKNRVPIPADIKADISYASAETCCMCEYPNRPLQIHHINEDPSCNEIDNLVLLCLDCHNKTQIKGGFAKKISPTDIKTFRNKWYARVAKIRRSVDEIKISDLSSMREHQNKIYEFKDDDIFEKENPQLTALILSIKSIYEAILRQAEVLYGVGDTYNMRNGLAIEVDGLSRIIKELQSHYPDNHFSVDKTQCREDLNSMMWDYAYKIAAPWGMSEAGTIIHIEAGAIYVNFLKFQINQLVKALLPSETSLTGNEWQKMKFQIS